MSIATELALLASTKENLRVSLGLSKDVPFSQYASHVPFYAKDGTVFDFANNQYSKDQLPVSLSDISEFIRLSYATKWQDGQLVEVANNIPRISGDGLLIEPQRTNNGDAVSTLMTTPAFPMSDEILISTSTSQSIGQSRKLTLDREGLLNTRTLSTNYAHKPTLPTIFVKSSCRYLRVIVSASADYSVVYDLQTGSIVAKGSTLGFDPIIEKHGEWFRVSMVSFNMTSGYFNIIEASDTLNFRAPMYPQQAGDYIEVWAAQREVADEDLKPTSYIFNNDVPVTRSPDILNIPLLPTQSFTGDWDAGVSYSVAGGIATFAGHGYIRNIVVEAL